MKSFIRQFPAASEGTLFYNRSTPYFEDFLSSFNSMLSYRFLLLAVQSISPFFICSCNIFLDPLLNANEYAYVVFMKTHVAYLWE